MVLRTSELKKALITHLGKTHRQLATVAIIQIRCKMASGLSSVMLDVCKKKNVISSHLVSIALACLRYDLENRDLAPVALAGAVRLSWTLYN